MFLRNCWYAAGWSRDFVPGKLYPLTIVNEPIVVYRGESVTAVALIDRCCHRLAPLSMGRLEGENLRCMYHGLKFAPSGRCVEIPGETKIPPQVKVRSYPICDKYSIAWIWMGDAARADEALIPEFVGVDDPNWAMRPGRMDYQANYTLINENLLDLSHIAFLHENSLGATLTPEGTGPATVTRLARGVRIQNWLIGGEPPGRSETPRSGRRTNVWQTYEFLAPGIFLLRADVYPDGTANRFDQREPDGAGMFHSQFTCQAVTPLTDKTTCYFFAYGPWAKEPHLKEKLYDLGVRAFNEDRVMIEAQQRNIDLAPETKMIRLSVDAGIAQFHRVMNGLMREEMESSATPSTNSASENAPMSAAAAPK
jgi:phenylpropionate dioxygenase-like ring-hydroxylating dioxygenase large terminal subunit